MSTIALAPRRVPSSCRRALRRSSIRWDRLAALLAAVAVGLWVLGAALATGSEADEAPVAPVSVVVRPGDTVYELAQQHRPAGVDTLSYAALVAEVNDVDARAILPGTVLLLPQEP